MFFATDIANFLACQHIATLNRDEAAGKIKKALFPDPGGDLLKKLGLQHEQKYLKELNETQGITLIEAPTDGPWAKAAGATVEAMRAGADAIYQATLLEDSGTPGWLPGLGGASWGGRADFLIRVDRPSDLGGWSYEVVETKLARSTKARAIIQLCFYSDLLSRIQGVTPEYMHVVLGGGAGTEKYFVQRYLAYFRKVRGEFEAADQSKDVTYPEPVELCRVCDWASTCDRRWRDDDHLSLVAGITGNQRKVLIENRITTVAELGRLELPVRPKMERIGDQALLTIREQARLQIQGREQGHPVYELLQPAEEGRGLCSLPSPSAGDMFLDFEGDQFAFEQGLEYLFGVVTLSDAGTRPLPRGGTELTGLQAEARPSERPQKGEAVYSAVWAFNRAEEKKAFEDFIATVMERLRLYPDMHIYHYGAYEETAIKRMAGQHGTCVDEVDQLLRRDVLVDLYRAVKQGVRASVESYSIKKMEPLYGFEREVQLLDANLALHTFQAVLAFGPGDEDIADIRKAIEGYNRDDCVSTLRLRNWLEEKRRGLEVITGAPLPRPAPKTDEEPGEDLSAYLARVRAVEARLTSNLPEDETEWTEEQKGRWLLAQLLEWHRREDKSAYWEYFRRCELTDEELQEDKSALGGLEYEGVVDKVKKSLVHRYRFPLQDHAIDRAKTVHDPRTQAPAGDVVAIDERALTIDIKRGVGSKVAHPTGLVPYDIIGAKVLRESLLQLGEWVADNGMDGEEREGLTPLSIGRGDGGEGLAAPQTPTPTLPQRERETEASEQTELQAPTLTLPQGERETEASEQTELQAPTLTLPQGEREEEYQAARELLLRKPPRLRGGTLTDLAANHESIELAKQVAMALDHTVLPIQGPPGSGKTYTGARMIVELVRNGKKVGITAVSHKVISKLLEETCAAAREAGLDLKAMQKVDTGDCCEDEMVTRAKDNDAVVTALAGGDVKVVAGTIWLWARNDMADSVDVLFVDEAGQMSLANVLAASPAAKSVVLLGDPQQLDQPQRGVHPPGAGASALSHLLNERATIGEDQGLFLADSWRLHPDVCRFTSEVFYDGRLVSRPENSNQRLNYCRGGTPWPPLVPSEGRASEGRPRRDAPTTFDGAGLKYVPVNHTGNQSESPEEVERVAEIVDSLLREGTTWTNKKGETAPLLLKNILIVAPYNAQVSALARRLPPGARVGTVDKFQGQEAPVVIYSMTTSAPEDAPRGMEFLYSSNRLNVATSRAQCVTVLVANPKLFDVQCRTPRQIELANAFCRYLELAQVI
ncbi:MAG: TM0106 family RecB-like putative nuclease [Pyrinomonadaceae bacterium]